MFVYDELKDFLKLAKQRVAIFPLRQAAETPGLILRHDVDLDVDSAIAMSYQEEAVGVRSSYFFLTTSPTYNVTSRSNLKALRDLHSRGFEVALHFDPLVYEDVSNLEIQARAEADLLSKIIGAPVNSVSIHNPDALGDFPLFPTFRNAYDKDFFWPGNYSSDSRMVFRTPPEKIVELAQSQIAQLNLHPEHFSETGGPYPKPILEYIARRIDEVDILYRENAGYKEAVTGSLMRYVATYFRQEST